MMTKATCGFVALSCLYSATHSWETALTITSYHLIGLAIALVINAELRSLIKK